MEFLTQHLQALYSLIGYSDMVTQRVSLQKNVAGDGEKALVLLSKPLHYHTRKTKGRDLKSLAGARRQEDRLEREREIADQTNVVHRQETHSNFGAVLLVHLDAHTDDGRNRN